MVEVLRFGRHGAQRERPEHQQREDHREESAVRALAGGHGQAACG